MGTRRAWLMFGIAAAAYIVAVMQRSSLGVAAVEATARFDIAATALSTLAVVQLIVYASLQIPVGVVVDRVGPRFLIASGAALMAVGQTTLAVSTSVGVAIVGRIIVGAGDAMTFISAIRLLSGWFPGRSLPLLSQLMGMIGSLGQVISAFPLSAALHEWGWAPAYLSAASMSVIVCVVVVVILRDSFEPRPPSDERPDWASSLRYLMGTLRTPGTQLGFWSHFVTPGPNTAFTLLWGFPFLSVGLGYGPTAAAFLITLTVAVGVVGSPIIGLLTARFPLRRSNLVLTSVFAMGVVWTLLLTSLGDPPLWLVISTLVVTALGGPASLVGLDFARSFNPARVLGSATGIVNVGGFASALSIMFLVGVVLDLMSRTTGGGNSPDELYSFDSFRIAFIVQYIVVGVGVVFLLRARKRTRTRMWVEEGIEVDPLRVVLLRELRRRG